MFCPKCAAPNLENAAYCRSCGFQVGGPEAGKLTGYAIAKFIIGDVFVLPAILLMALESAVQTPLWLLLAVPGLLLYTWAAVDLVKARSLKRQQKEVPGKSVPKELGIPVLNGIPDDFTTRGTAVSVTDSTTRRLR